MQTYIYDPLNQLLVLLYSNINDIGWTIIALTLIVKILLLPLNIKAGIDGEKTQRVIKKIKPSLDKIKDKHKGDKMAEYAATQALYKEEKFNPISGLLSILIILLQMPILFGLYHVFNTNLSKGYNLMAFGLFDISQKYIWMGLLSGVTMYIMGSITMKKKSQEGETEMQIAMTNAMRIQVVYFFPVLLAVIGAISPAGIGIYLVFANLFGIVQYYILDHFKKRISI